VGRRLASLLSDVVEPHALQRTVRTWSGRLPLLRIDHVFATPGVRALHVAIPRQRLERTASDHLPVVVDLEVPDAAAV
jgi:endonuclease/exonuclease/phosphatase family metal-dependent hydrolase